MPHPEIGEALEADEVVAFDTCPFPLPTPEDREFLPRQRVAAGWKNVAWDPGRERLLGLRAPSEADAARVRGLLSRFSEEATRWLAGVLPRHAASWQPDQATLRPLDEADRRLPRSARNDLLHVDAFPGRPSRGRRILRLFVNLHPAHDRVWVTSMPASDLIARHADRLGLPGRTRWIDRWRLLLPAPPGRTPYDACMLRLHDRLKADRELQETAPRRTWRFAPGSAWLAFTDGVSHAVVSGALAMEHSWFVPLHALAQPDRSPAATLARLAGRPLAPGA